MTSVAGSVERSKTEPHPDPGMPGLAVMVLAAAMTAMLLQATRVFLSYMVFIVDQAERMQLGTTAGGVYLAIALGAVLPRVLGIRRTFLVLTAAAVGARLALQFWSMPEARMWLAAAVIVLAGWALPALLVASRAGAAYGVGIGLALDLAVRIGRESVDLPFNPSVGAHLVTLVLALLALVAALSLTRSNQPERATGRNISALAFGPALGLHHLVTGNLGIVQVKLDTGLHTGAWMLTAGILLGLAIDRLAALNMSSGQHYPERTRIATLLLVLTGALGLLMFWHDLAGLAGAGLVIGGAAFTALTVTALRGDATEGASSVPATAVWLTVGMLLQAIVLFVYFSATGLPTLVAGLFGVVAVVGLLTIQRPVTATGDTSPRIALAGFGVATAVLVLTTGIVALRADEPAASGPLPAQFTVMTYNIQSGFSRDNHWDLEAIASVIEADDPDIVLLQEVGRGWPILTGVDQAHWLSNRLDMQLVWGPASRDDLWGNAILTRAPILETAYIKYGTTENLRRGAVRATLASEAEPVTVIATHLDNPGDADSARQAQIAQLLAFRDGAAPSVIGGDFNAEPTSAAITTLTGVGLIDAGALLGPDATTSEGGKRIDYVLVTPGLGVINASIPDTWASDHRPFVTQLAFSP